MNYVGIIVRMSSEMWCKTLKFRGILRESFLELPGPFRYVPNNFLTGLGLYGSNHELMEESMDSLSRLRAFDVTRTAASLDVESSNSLHWTVAWRPWVARQDFFFTRNVHLRSGLTPDIRACRFWADQKEQKYHFCLARIFTDGEPLLRARRNRPGMR